MIDIPEHFGTEIDIRSYGSSLILHHEPGLTGDRLEDYLDAYKHGTLVLNIKEAGVENDVLNMVKDRGISSYFLLDVEMPFVYRASQEGIREVAIRYSEYEPIELAEHFSGVFDWVWIDTVTHLPITPETMSTLAPYRSCLVCPERWGRPEDIGAYITQMKKAHFLPNAVMTAKANVDQWAAWQND